MSTYTETRTSPTDVLNRLHEVEVVLQAVIDKIADLEPGEGGDVSAIQASLDRLYKLTLRTAQPGSSPTPGDYDETTIFDDGEGNGSFFGSVYGPSSGAYKTTIQAMAAGSIKALFPSLFTATDTRFMSSSQPVVTRTYGTEGTTAANDYVLALTAQNKSLAAAIFGTPAMLTAFATGTSNSLATITYGSGTSGAAWVNAIKAGAGDGFTLVEIAFGSRGNLADIETSVWDDFVEHRGTVTGQIEDIMLALSNHAARLAALEAA